MVLSRSLMSLSLRVDLGMGYKLSVLLSGLGLCYHCAKYFGFCLELCVSYTLLSYMCMLFGICCIFRARRLCFLLPRFCSVGVLSLVLTLLLLAYLQRRVVCSVLYLRDALVG